VPEKADDRRARRHPAADWHLDTVAFAPVPSARRRIEEVGLKVEACRLCPRLVAWREATAASPPAAHSGETYWGRPIPGFGDPDASLVVVGLAPAAHGGNRTGRMFTGDRSGDFLVAALHRSGFANQATSVARDDGLELRRCWITAAVRCAPPGNLPSRLEQATCLRYLKDELDLLTSCKVILALGAIAFEAVSRLVMVGPDTAADSNTPADSNSPADSSSASGSGARVRRRSGGGQRLRFSHGLEVRDSAGRTVVCSYHPSQRNVFTGLLTAEMLDAVLTRVAELCTPGR